VPRASLFLAIFAAIFSLAPPEGALACACCTNQGQRNVDVVALDSGIREQFESLRFADTAKLYVGEADPEGIERIASPSDSYLVKAAWQGNKLVFALRDAGGHAGTLTLAVRARSRSSRSTRATVLTRAQGLSSTRNGS
jgi:hypothetical protein